MRLERARATSGLATHCVHETFRCNFTRTYRFYSHAQISDILQSYLVFLYYEAVQMGTDGSRSDVKSKVYH